MNVDPACDESQALRGLEKSYKKKSTTSKFCWLLESEEVEGMLTEQEMEKYGDVLLWALATARKGKYRKGILSLFVMTWLLSGWRRFFNPDF